MHKLLPSTGARLFKVIRSMTKITMKPTLVNSSVRCMSTKV